MKDIDSLKDEVDRHWYTLLIVAILAYVSFGIFHGMAVHRPEFMVYYILCSSVSFSVGTICKRFLPHNKNVPPRMFTFACILGLVNTGYLASVSGFTPLDFIFCFLLAVGSLELTWMMPRRYIVLNYLSAFIFAGAIVFFAAPILPTKFYVLIALGIYFAWKAVNTTLQSNVYHSYADHSKMSAFRGTIISLTHHFNNISTVILGYLGTEDRNSEADRELDIALSQLVHLIDEVGKIETFQEEVYLGKETMLHIPNQNRRSDIAA